MSENSPEQRYGPTSGTVTGVIGLLCCALVVVVAIAGGLSPTSARVAFASLALAVLAWAYLLKPRIIVAQGGATLVLRNPLVTHRVPLAAVKVVGVRTVTTVKTEDERFDAVAVGYPLRKVVRGTAGRPGAGGMSSAFGTLRMPSVPVEPQRAREPHLADRDIQQLMTDRILAAADRARATGLPAGPAERRYAVLELGLLAASVIAFALSFAF